MRETVLGRIKAHRQEQLDADVHLAVFMPTPRIAAELFSYGWSPLFFPKLINKTTSV
jgi:hypothetical protein